MGGGRQRSTGPMAETASCAASAVRSGPSAFWVLPAAALRRTSERRHTRVGQLSKGSDAVCPRRGAITRVEGDGANVGLT
jgi:hypothetical protein